MKLEMEFTMDLHGVPTIRVKHCYKDTGLEQMAFNSFIELSKKNGLDITNPTGHMLTGGTEADYWEIYEIKPVKTL